MEKFKDFIIGILIFIVWSAGCFFGGWLYNNRTTTSRIDSSDKQYTDLQCKYDDEIRNAAASLSNITNDIREEIYISTRAVTNIQELISEIRKQKIHI